MSRVIFNSLVCLTIAGGLVEASPPVVDHGAVDRGVVDHHGVVDPGVTPDNLRRQSRATLQESNTPHREVFSFVEPSKTPLVIEPGRSCLLHFPAGVRRTALSNGDVGDVVQVGPEDVLILGRNRGVANFTVWPSNPAAAPAVIVVRVARKPRPDE